MGNGDCTVKGPGITYAEIDLDYLDKIRKQIPSLENRRSDLYEVSEKK